MKKLKYLVLTAFLMVMPAVYAEDSNYATVQDITNADTHEGGTKEVVGSQTSKTTLTYSEGTFNVLGENDEGRPEGYAWIGIRVTVPTSATEVKLDGEDMTSELNSGKTFDRYFGFNPETLEADLRDGKENRVKTFVLTYKISEQEYTQTISIVINPANIVIKDEDKTDTIWDDTKYEEVMDDIAASEEELEKDDSPKTGVVDYTLIAGIIAAASMGAYLDLKKRFN